MLKFANDLKLNPLLIVHLILTITKLNKMTKETKIIAGLLAGAALGAAVALILSTDKGDDLKESVTDWLADILDSSKDKIADVASSVKDSIAKATA
ncbi:gas vesicle protein [Pedobacter sp. CG_S7]